MIEKSITRVFSNLKNSYRRCESFFLTLPLFKSDSPFFFILNLIFLFVYLLNLWNIPIELIEWNSENEITSEFKRDFTTFLKTVGLISGLLDVFFALNVPYYSKGVFVKDRIKIIKNYFKNNFWLDLFAIGPIFIQKLTSEDTYLNFNFFFLLIKIKKIVDQIEDHFQFQDKNQALFNLIKLLTKVITIAHFFACIWNYLAYWEINVLKMTDTWMHSLEIENERWEIKYINSLYYSIVTMVTVGYGDISPRNPIEKAFAVVIIILACGFFAYALNSVGQILNEMNRMEDEFK